MVNFDSSGVTNQVCLKPSSTFYKQYMWYWTIFVAVKVYLLSALKMLFALVTLNPQKTGAKCPWALVISPTHTTCDGE